jgi:hypothetical protein
VNNIFGLLENQGRMDFLLLEGRRNLEENEIACLTEFASHFSICRENRNIIAHSMMLTSELFRIDFHKRPRGKGSIMLMFPIDKEAMERVAREMITTYRFGNEIVWSICTHPGILSKAGLYERPKSEPIMTIKHRQLPEVHVRPYKLSPLAR